MNTHTSTTTYNIQLRSSRDRRVWYDSPDQPDEAKVSERAAIKWLTLRKDALKNNRPDIRYRLQIRVTTSLTIKETIDLQAFLNPKIKPKTAKK